MILRSPLHFRSLVSLILVVSVIGCDGVRTKTQTLTVAVEDRDGTPASNVRISIKETWESWKAGTSMTTKTDEVEYRRRWESSFVPWSSDVSGSNGVATVTFKSTGLDSGDRERPPVDMVSNREYIVNLQGQHASEEVRLAVLAGAFVEGQFFRFTVVDIGKPQWSPYSH